jgi:general secretion pathway protein D
MPGAFATALGLAVVVATAVLAWAEADSPDQPVTRVIAPRFVSAATAANVVRPLVSSHGSITVPPLDNVLIVTDAAANVAKVAAVVERLDIELTANEVRIIRLQYADASYLAGLLNHVFSRQAVPPVIVADRRTNSLVIRGRRSELDAIGRLVGHDR